MTLPSIPGERLLESMWNTLTQHGIGRLLRPWQLRREGRAATDVEIDRTIRLAQAQRIAGQIERGELQVMDAVLPPGIAVAQSVHSSHATPVEHRLYEDDFRHILRSATTSTIIDAIRREINEAHAILHAESILTAESIELPHAEPDSDWLYRWREAAGGVTEEQLQSFWGRVLAGEIKQPGSFSLRTLEFLRHVSRDEARLIERLSAVVTGPLVSEGWSALIYRDWSALNRAGISRELIAEMQTLGILAISDEKLDVSIRSTAQHAFEVYLTSNGRVLSIRHPDHDRTLRLPAYALTALGKEVISLSTAEPSLDFLHHLAEKICSQGFAVFLAPYQSLAGTQITIGESELICAPEGLIVSPVPDPTTVVRQVEDGE